MPETEIRIVATTGDRNRKHHRRRRSESHRLPRRSKVGFRFLCFRRFLCSLPFPRVYRWSTKKEGGGSWRDRLTELRPLPGCPSRAAAGMPEPPPHARCLASCRRALPDALPHARRQVLAGAAPCQAACNVPDFRCISKCK